MGGEGEKVKGKEVCVCVCVWTLSADDTRRVTQDVRLNERKATQISHVRLIRGMWVD